MLCRSSRGCGFDNLQTGWFGDGIFEDVFRLFQFQEFIQTLKITIIDRSPWFLVALPVTTLTCK